MATKKNLNRLKRKLYVVAIVSIGGRLLEFILGVVATATGIFFIYLCATQIGKVTFDQGYNFLILGLGGLVLIRFSPPMAKEGFVELLTALNTLRKYRSKENF